VKIPPGENGKGREWNSTGMGSRFDGTHISGMGVGMTEWEWEGLGIQKTLPAHH